MITSHDTRPAAASDGASVPASLTNAQRERLRALGAATLHEAQGQRGALDAGLKPLDPSCTLAGPAFTVDLCPGDNLMVHYAMEHVRPGDVLVLDAKGFTEAGPWGDVLTLAAQLQGLAGLVIHGAVRDGNAIIDMGFPVFARGLSIKGTSKRQPGRVQVPVVLGGVTIRPGDIVVGDRDGLVVVAADELETVLAAAEARETKEDVMRAELRQGKRMVELLQLAPALQQLGLR